MLLALGRPGVTLVTDLIVSHAQPDRAGAAPRSPKTAASSGGALGIALLEPSESSPIAFPHGRVPA